MRIAIFSDVHGNLTALKAVLADIDRRSPDIVAFAGDLCLFGPRPAECIALVKERNISSVYGNTDLWVLDPPEPPAESSEKQRRHMQHLQEVSLWTQTRLDERDLDWLRTRPFAHRISPTASPEDDLLIVHANPQDVNQLIFPTAEKQILLFGEVQGDQPDEALAPLLGGVSAGVVAFGHLHVPNVRRWRKLTLANISSVSLAGDGDARAKYGLLTWEQNSGWSVEHAHVPYELQRELDALAAAELPRGESYARRLQNAGR